MNTPQHISMHVERLIGAVLLGGLWHADRFQVALCPAGLVAAKAMKRPALRNRVNFSDACRKA